VSPPHLPPIVVASGSNCCVNFNESPSHVEDGALTVGKYYGEQAVVFDGEAGEEVTLIEVPISFISNANLIAHSVI